MKKQHRPKFTGIKDALQNWLSDAERVVIIGFGSRIRRDDFVGIDIVRKLVPRTSKNICLIQCETVLEDFIESISEFDPTHVLIIDAAHLNLEPGYAKLVGRDQMDLVQPISTHLLPLRIFCKYVAKKTEAKIALLAIQPKDISFGEGLTVEIGKTVEYMTNLLSIILP